MSPSSENRSLTQLYLTIIAFLLVASFLQWLNLDLSTPLSPKGMTSFELAGKDGYKVLDEWWDHQETRIVPTKKIDHAILYTRVDFVFILVYGFLLWQLINRSAPVEKEQEALFAERKKFIKRKTWISIGRILLLLAAVMDLSENLFILMGLHSGSYDTTLVKVLVSIKLAVLGAIALAIAFRSLRWFSAVINRIIIGIWLFRLVILGLIVTFLVLWVMDQGQDLLLSVTGSPLGPMVTLFVLSIFAACNWYLPKYYQLPDRGKLTIRNFFFSSWDYQSREHTEYTFTGRLLGALTLMLPGACILHAMQVFRVDYWLSFISPITLLIILLIFYYLILKRQWLCNQRTVIVIAGISLALIITFGVWATTQKSRLLGYFALDFFLLSFVFLLYTSIRKNTVKWRPFDMPVTPFITLPTLLVSLLFLYENLNPLQFALDEKGRSLTLAVVFTSLIFYVFILTILLLIGKKLKIQILTLLIAVGFILGAVIPNNYHQIRLYSYEKHNEARVGMDSLKQYARAWLSKREVEILAADSLHPYPIVIVNAPGGGIRAAAWTSKVMNALDTALRNRKVRNLPDDFQHYVFGYSCASGGTLGAAVICAQRYNRLVNGEAKALQKADLYKKDFLTPVFIQLFGRDIWLAFAGTSDIADRAIQQEKVWEKQCAKSMDSLELDKPLTHYWPKSGPGYYEVPLLFANSYVLETGRKAIIAPVLLSPADFPVSFLMSNYLARTSQDSLTLILSTAALLTARFPFISPAGKLDGFKHFLDGGFTENSGAETAEEVRRVLKRTIDSLGWADKTRITMLSLPNSIFIIDTLQTAKNLFEIGAPLTGAINTSVGNTYKAGELQRLRAKEEGYEIAQIRPVESKPDQGTLVPLLPLGWQISDDALRYMDASIRDGKNDQTIQRLVSKIAGR